MTVSCFGEGEPLNLLTLIQGSAILSGTQYGRQLVTRIGLFSCSGLPVRAETSSTCWVFALTSILLILNLAFESMILQERTGINNPIVSANSSILAA